MSLDEAVDTLGGAGTVEFRWDPFFASGTIVAGGREAAFASGSAGESGMVLIDHREVLTLPLPYLENGILRFPELFVSQLSRSFGLFPGEDSYGSDRFRIAAIIIDPGHGGKDPGASATHTVNGRTITSVEKDITLKVARMLYATLVAAFPDKKILITREGDTTLTLDERVDMANTITLNKNEAAIFVSVHANSAWPNKDARGFEVWYLTPSFRREVLDRTSYDNPEEVFPILNSMMEEELTTESILLADAILKRLQEAIGRQSPSRGLKAEEWFVVRNARMPSVLVEMGFVSNEAEAVLMNSEAHLKNLSDALYKGISDFITFFEHSGGLISLP
jgi:N-acetylmuramoyl-L-alanine amidase